MSLIYYLPLKKTHFALQLQLHCVRTHCVELSISLNLCISSEFSELLAHITCKMQRAFFVILSLPFSSEVSLLSTADCQACLTCLRLSSLPALPVPYGLLTSSYWNEEAWLGLLTKQLLWKKTRMLQFLLQQFRLCLQCHFLAAFSVSEHAAWSGVSLYGFFFTRNFGLFKKWKTTRKHKYLHSVLISIEGSSHVKQGRFSQWIIIRKKSDALLVHLPSSNLRSLYAHHFILLSSLTLPSPSMSVWQCERTLNQAVKI